MKVLWFSYAKGWETYNPLIHSQLVCKFLYWAHQEGILLTGQLEVVTHRQLCTLAMTAELVPHDLPDGAGDAFNGQIDGWESRGFSLETPESLRPLIINALDLSE